MKSPEQEHRVQLLLSREKNRELLESWFVDRPGYMVLQRDTNEHDLQPSDLIILDDPYLSRFHALIAEYRSSEQPVFLPILLVQTNADFPTDGEPFSLVDDIIETPIRQGTLAARVENLLERRRLSQQLYDQFERSEERFRRIFESANDAIFVVGVEDGELLECNPAACSLTGYTRDQLLSLSPSRDLHPDDADHYRQFILDVEENGRGWTDELTYRMKEGRRIIAEVSASTIEVDGFTSILMCARDVTQRKLSDQQLQVLNRILRHNLRNDINIIHGCGQFLLSNADSTDLQEYAHRIVETADELLKLGEKSKEINRIIQWHQDPRHIDIIQVIDILRRNVESENPSVSIQTDFPDNADVIADDRIHYVLEELVENAIKHNEHPDPVIKIEVTVEPDTVCVEIADNGPGISPQEHAVLKGEETPLLHGSGIGLWIVNWIVASVGGEFDLANRAPGGSIVTVTLPRSTVATSSHR